MKALNIIILAIILPVALYSQGDGRDNLHFGLKGGVNFSNVYSVKEGNFDGAQRIGYMAGAFVQVPFGKFIGIQPEAIVSQKGTNGRGNIDGTDYTLKRTTTTLDFPIMLQLKPIRFISIVAGPQFSFLLAQRDKYDTPDNITITRQYENQSYRKANIGVVGGVDVNIFAFVVSGRVGCDLQRNTTNASASTTAPNYKNMWGQVALGLRF